MELHILLLTASAAYLGAQSVRQPNVEFDMMTWVEVKRAIHEEGKINVIVYNGGTEQRGPQNVNDYFLERAPRFVFSPRVEKG